MYDSDQQSVYIVNQWHKPYQQETKTNIFKGEKKRKIKTTENANKENNALHINNHDHLHIPAR